VVETSACLGTRDECEEYRHTNFKYRVGKWTECSSFHGGGGGGGGGGGVGAGKGGAGVGGGGGVEKLHSRGFTSQLGQRRRVVDCIDVKGKTVDRR